MASYKPIQAEEIILSEDSNEYKLTFPDMPNCIIVDCISDKGERINISFKDNIIKPIGKSVKLKKGDIIKYIAIL